MWVWMDICPEAVQHTLWHYSLHELLVRLCFVLGIPPLRMLKEFFRFSCCALQLTSMFCCPFLAASAKGIKHKLSVLCTPSSIPKFEALLLKCLLELPISFHWYLLSIGVIPLSKFCICSQDKITVYVSV